MLSKSPASLDACTLDSWMATATEGLCQPATERIEAEIRTHYTESVAVEIVEGRTEHEANRAAMAALGDPNKARKGFRRTFLTEKEAKGLARFAAEAKKSALSAFALLGLIILLMIIGAAGDPSCSLLTLFSYRPLTLAFLALAIEISILALIIPYSAQRQQWRRVFIWRSVGIFLVFVALVNFHVEHGAMTGKADPARAIFVAMFGLNFVVVSLTSVQMLRKLGKHADLYDSIIDRNDDGRYA